MIKITDIAHDSLISASYVWHGYPVVIIFRHGYDELDPLGQSDGPEHMNLYHLRVANRFITWTTVYDTYDEAVKAIPEQMDRCKQKDDRMAIADANERANK